MVRWAGRVREGILSIGEEDAERRRGEEEGGCVEG